MDSLTNVMQCEAKHVINLKPDAIILDAADLLYCRNPQSQVQLFVHQKTDHFYWNILLSPTVKNVKPKYEQPKVVKTRFGRVVKPPNHLMYTE